MSVTEDIKGKNVEVTPTIDSSWGIADDVILKVDGIIVFEGTTNEARNFISANQLEVDSDCEKYL